MKRKVLFILTGILVLALAFPAFAAVSGLTDKQKQEIFDLQEQIAELRKQIVDKYVEAGKITADEGKAIKERIDQAEKYRRDNGILPGFGPGRSRGGGCGVYGGSKVNDFGDWSGVCGRINGQIDNQVNNQDVL